MFFVVELWLLRRPDFRIRLTKMEKNYDSLIALSQGVMFWLFALLNYIRQEAH